MTTRPELVAVGPHYYRVVTDPHGVLAAEGLRGHCDAQSLNIVVAPDLQPTGERETVLHELIHAHLRPLEALEALPADVAELITQHLGEALLDLFRRNHDLVAWLLE